MNWIEKRYRSHIKKGSIERFFGSNDIYKLFGSDPEVALESFIPMKLGVERCTSGRNGVQKRNHLTAKNQRVLCNHAKHRMGLQ